MDRLLRTGGLDALWPETIPFYQDWGLLYEDISRVYRRAKTMKMVSAEWTKIARNHESLAKKAERTGHDQTAGEEYHRAAIAYCYSRQSIPADTKGRLLLHDKVTGCYDKAIEYSSSPIERVEIKYGHSSIPGILHLPSGAKKVPCVIVVSGMHMSKEYLPSIHDNRFLKRGLAVLSIDVPGQGECNTRKIKMTADSHIKAGIATINYLEEREGIAADKIGIIGIAFGSLNSIRICASDHRIKACATIIGEYYNPWRMIEENSPNIRTMHRYTTGTTSDEALKKVMQAVSVAGYEHLVKCPVLLSHGEFDELCSVEEAYTLYGKLRVPKELRVYEGELHQLGSAYSPAMSYTVDWLADRLSGRKPSRASTRLLVRAT